MDFLRSLTQAASPLASSSFPDGGGGSASPGGRGGAGRRSSKAIAPSSALGSPAMGERHNAPLRRASPAQRSYMASLRKRTSSGAISVASAAAATAVPAALHRVGSAPLGPCAQSPPVGSCTRPPAFSPEWSAASSARGSPCAPPAGRPLVATAPVPSELDGLSRAASAPRTGNWSTPPGSSSGKRKRSSSGHDSPSHTQRQRLSSSSAGGNALAVVGGNAGLELWSGADWDLKERAVQLLRQLEAERSARSSAEARVRLLEQVRVYDPSHLSVTFSQFATTLCYFGQFLVAFGSFLGLFWKSGGLKTEATGGNERGSEQTGTGDDQAPGEGEPAARAEAWV